MKRQFLFMLFITFLFSACKEEPKCCCINFSLEINVQLIDSSKSISIDTNYIKTNNRLSGFSFNDSVSYLQLRANIDSTQDDKVVNTVSLLHISSTLTDTIITEINGTCGRSITKIWYNGILKYPNAAYNNQIVIVK